MENKYICSMCGEETPIRFTRVDMISFPEGICGKCFVEVDREITLTKYGVWWSMED